MLPKIMRQFPTFVPLKFQIVRTVAWKFCYSSNKEATHVPAMVAIVRLPASFYDEVELTEPRLEPVERLVVLPPCVRLRAELVALSS